MSNNKTNKQGIFKICCVFVCFIRLRYLLEFDKDFDCEKIRGYQYYSQYNHLILFTSLQLAL